MKLFGAIVLGIAGTGFAWAGVDHSAQVQKLNQALASAERADRIAACRALYLSGIVDEAFFDELAGRLGEMLRTLPPSPDDRTPEADELAYCVTGLASSGMAKYVPLMRELRKADPSKVDANTRKILRNAPHELADAARLNPLLNADAGVAPGRPAEVAVAYNMLVSGEIELEEAALRRVIELGPEHPDLYDGVAAALLQLTRDGVRGRELGSIVSHYCKILGRTGNPKYIETLKQVSESAESVKVRRYAEKYREQLQAKVDEARP